MKFDEARCVRDAKREASGLAAADIKFNEAADMRCDAADTVLKGESRTPEGARALLLFAAEYVANMAALTMHESFSGS